MDSVNVSVEVKKEASRLELFVRLVYWIPLVIVMWILGFLTGIILFVNIFSVLFLGKRVLTEIIEKYWAYVAKMNAYFLLLSDERPPIIPE
jgi:hypothetical protein